MSNTEERKDPSPASETRADDWVEDDEGVSKQGGEWEEEAPAAGAARKGAKPRVPAAYLHWIAGIVGVLLGFFMFRSC